VCVFVLKNVYIQHVYISFLLFANFFSSFYASLLYNLYKFFILNIEKHYFLEKTRSMRRRRRLYLLQ